MKIKYIEQNTVSVDLNLRQTEIVLGALSAYVIGTEPLKDEVKDEYVLKTAGRLLLEEGPFTLGFYGTDWTLDVLADVIEGSNKDLLECRENTPAGVVTQFRRTASLLRSLPLDTPTGNGSIISLEEN